MTNTPYQTLSNSCTVYFPAGVVVHTICGRSIGELVGLRASRLCIRAVKTVRFSSSHKVVNLCLMEEATALEQIEYDRERVPCARPVLGDV